MESQQIKQFQSFILRFYTDHGRHHLPWRVEQSPYNVLVSEIMLQQTQVERVIPKFNQFISALPTVESLAHTTIANVIIHWQGLGYNRRGLNLQRAAQAICDRYDGVVPSSTSDLLSLPGVGPYTASAIQAFAFNQPSTVIETNIRAVFIYHFFNQSYSVTDDDLLPLIEQTLFTENPRIWYSALMDYGTYLKKVLPNPSRQSHHHTQQSKFAGSMRQVRGKILSAVSAYQPITIKRLETEVDIDAEKFTIALDNLIKEGFLTNSRDHISLKS